MALDEPKDTDDVFNIDGFQYIVDKNFMGRARPIKIDFLVNGFQLDCSIDFGAACSSCSTAETCG